MNKNSKPVSIGPFQGISDTITPAGLGHIKNVENMEISDLGTVKQRSGTRVIDTTDSEYYDMFNIKISGVEIVIAIEYHDYKWYAFSDKFPEKKMKLRSSSPIAEFFGNTTHLGFKGGSRFKVLDAKDLYYVWTNHNNEILIIRKNGSLYIGKDVEQDELYANNISDVIDYARVPTNDDLAVYVDAFPFNSSDEVDLYFDEKADYFPINQKSAFIAEINSLGGTGITSSQSLLEHRPAGGVFSPFKVENYKSLSRGVFTRDELIFDSFYYRAGPSNTSMVTRTTTFPTITKNADDEVEGYLAYAEETSSSTGIVSGAWAFIYIQSKEYWDASGSVWLASTPVMTIDESTISDYPLEFISTTSMGSPVGEFENREVDKLYAWSNPSPVPYSTFTATETTAPGSLYRWTYRVLYLIEDENIKRPWETRAGVEIPSEDTVTDVGIKHFTGVVAKTKLQVHNLTSTTCEIPELYLGITKSKLHTVDTIVIKEKRFQDEIKRMISGVHNDFASQNYNMKDIGISVDGDEYDYAFNDDGNEISAFFTNGFNLALYDTENSRRFVNRIGYSYLDPTTSELVYDAKSLPSTMVETPDSLAPKGTFTRYFKPYISTKYFNLLSKDISKNEGNSLPLQLKGSKDIAILDTKLYSLFDNYILIGSSVTLTLQNSIELTQNTNFIEPISGGILLIQDIGLKILKADLTVDHVFGGENIVVKDFYSNGSTVLICDITGELFVTRMQVTDQGQRFFTIKTISKGLMKNENFLDISSITFFNDKYIIATPDSIYIFNTLTGNFTGVYKPTDNHFFTLVSHLNQKLISEQQIKNINFANFFPDGFLRPDFTIDGGG